MLMPAEVEAAARRSWQRLAWVGVYAVAMGLLEAACVVYLRRLLMPAGYDPGKPLPPEFLESGLARVELCREACTLAMLLAVAWLAGSNLRSRIAFFFFAFGTWDVLYYVGLRWWTGWPASVLDWDCLFLIPKPWYGPVLAPVLISGYFALACCVTLVREQRGRPLRWGALAIVTQLAAGTIWFWSFIKDAERIGELGYDAAEYSWLLFLTGAIIGLAGLTLAARPVRVAEALEL